MSTSDTLVYVASAVLILWGVAHIAPTKSVAASFGDISLDSRRIFVMEWVAEGLTHISIGVLAVLITALEGSGAASDLVYRVLAAVLVALAVLTALTGARTPTIWFRVCPFVLTTAAALLVGGSFV